MQNSLRPEKTKGGLLKTLTARSAVSRIYLFLALLALAGCGAAQAVKDSTVAATEAVFIASVKTLKIDLIAREAVNSDDRQHPLSVMVRIYQLSDIKNFESNDYQTLFDSDREKLAADLLELKEVIVAPGGTVSIEENMHKDAKYVAVAAFFREEVGENWRLTIKRGDLSAGKPWKLELVDYRLNVFRE